MHITAVHCRLGENVITLSFRFAAGAAADVIPARITENDSESESADVGVGADFLWRLLFGVGLGGGSGMLPSGDMGTGAGPSEGDDGRRRCVPPDIVEPVWELMA